MKQTDEVRYCTPVHEVRVRSYGNLCPSDCGNRSLTGHADSAVCNERQVPLYSLYNSTIAQKYPWCMDTLQSQTIVPALLAGSADWNYNKVLLLNVRMCHVHI